MHVTRPKRRLATALVAAALLLGSGTAAVAKDGNDDGKASDRAQHAMEQAREHRKRRPAVAEIKGAVVAVTTTSRTFQVQVTDGNQPALKGTKVTVQLAPEAYLTLNDRKTTIADIKVGDSAKVTGLPDAATGPFTAYLVRFGRTAPAPIQVKGPVAAVSASGVTITVNALPVVLQLGTPSIVTLNGQPAALADVHVGDKAEATTVSGIAYVVRLTRPMPATPGPKRIDGTVLTASPLVLVVKGVNVPVVLATPSLTSLQDAPATLADIHVADRCTAVGIANPAGGITAYQLACLRG
ncbi:MAG: hypothetical protein JWN67_4016 [Actinomycetia bacterium]|nr:hypothetical protein [Actinomycetes bacterium]